MSNGLGAMLSAGVVGVVVWAFRRQMIEQEAAQPAVVTRTVQTGPSFKDLALQQVVGFAIDSFGDWSQSRNPEVSTLDAMQKASPPRREAVRPTTTTRRQTTSTGGVQSLLDMIATHEGGVDGYDVPYGGSRIQPPKPLSQMTVQEVRDWQDRSVRAGSASSAVGKYQIIRGTMDTVIAGGALDRNELFDADAQERAGRYLLDTQGGYRDYQRGRINEDQFGQRLATTWASLPATTRDQRGRPAQGQSYYAGDGLNRAFFSIDSLMSAIRGAT